jgi:hypothetical protein
MGDLDKNIYRKENPYEKIIIHPIEKDRKEKEMGYRGLGSATRSQALAALASFFKKMLSSLSPKARGEGYAVDIDLLLNDVTAFKKLLEILASEDTSHQPEFAEHLSELWHAILEGCNQIDASRTHAIDTIHKLVFFISQVENFPLGADHTLGYYFSQYAGKDWTPFPFMQLLQGLHLEYQASPPISVLYNWISLLDDILSRER